MVPYIKCRSIKYILFTGETTQPPVDKIVLNIIKKNERHCIKMLKKKIKIPFNN